MYDGDYWLPSRCTAGSIADNETLFFLADVLRLIRRLEIQLGRSEKEDSDGK